LQGDTIQISQIFELKCDGKVVRIPKQVQNLIFLNITSWAGGAMKLWENQPTE